jgi:hypothetical protein
MPFLDQDGALRAPPDQPAHWLATDAARLVLPNRDISSVFSVGASDPGDVKVGYGVIVGVLRHDRNAVSDRRSSDPAAVDRRPVPCRAELGDQERPDFGHRLVHGEVFDRCESWSVDSLRETASGF